MNAGENNNVEYVCNLPVELQQRAEAELNERPQWRDRDVMALRQMVIDSPDLHCPTDYAFLLRFLRAKKFDYDRAFASLRRYYDVRTKQPQIFASFLPSTVARVLDAGVITVLPNLDTQGRRVIWLRPGLWNPDEYPITDILKTMLLSLDWAIRSETVQINGICLLEDCANAGWKQLKHMSKDRIKMIAFLMQEAFPVRLKAIHIINAPLPMQHIISLIRLFLKEKLRERILVHGARLNNLIEDIGPHALPTEYGGQLKVEPHAWRDELLSAEVETYFKNRLGDGYVDAARKLADAGRRMSASSLTFPGTSPLLVEQKQVRVVTRSDNYETTMAFTSLAVCQNTVDSD